MDQLVGDLSKAQLCQMFIDKIPPMVRTLRGVTSETLDDRMQSAWTELIECAAKNRGLNLEAFVPYAMVRIRGAVIDDMRGDDPLPRSQRTQANKMTAAARAVSARTGKRASTSEVAQELGLAVSEIHDLLFRLHTDVIIYCSDLADEETIGQFTDSTLDTVIAQQMLEKLLLAIESLPERNRAVIELRYFHALPNREIARRLNVGDSRATELHNRSVEKLRKALKAA